MDDQQTNAQMVDELAQLPLAFQPGAAFEYGMSNDVLGRIVEVQSGLDLNQFIVERIARPLGMPDTAFLLDEQQTLRLAQPQAAAGAPPLVITWSIRPCYNILRHSRQYFQPRKITDLA